MSASWDKLILILAGLAVLGVSGLFLMKGLSFEKNFEYTAPTPDTTLEPTDEERVKSAIALVKTKQNWSPSVKGDPPTMVPLFVSIPLVEKSGDLINLSDPNDPPLRPPVPNSWFLKHGLDVLQAGILGQDADSDGYSNLEEFDGKTDPNDSQDHPPYTDKLYVKQRLQKEYRLQFAAQPDEKTFQIKRVPSAAFPKPQTFMMEVGEESKDGQFKVDGFKKNSAEKGGITIDASVVEITYLATGEKKRLLRNKLEVIPTFFGELEFKLGTVEPQYIKKGDTFTLSTDSTSKYRLVEIEPDKAKIEVQDASGAKKIVEIGTES